MDRLFKNYFYFYTYRIIIFSLPTYFLFWESLISIVLYEYKASHRCFQISKHLILGETLQPTRHNINVWDLSGRAIWIIMDESEMERENVCWRGSKFSFTPNKICQVMTLSVGAISARSCDPSQRMMEISSHAYEILSRLTRPT